MENRHSKPGEICRCNLELASSEEKSTDDSRAWTRIQEIEIRKVEKGEKAEALRREKARTEASRSE